MAGSTWDQKFLELARSGGGAVSRQQLRTLGCAGPTIDLRLASGLLVPILAGFYVAPLVASRISPARAVLLACPDGALARSTAARCHGFALPGAGLHVVVPHGTHLRARGVVVHETRHLPAVDVDVIDGDRVTSAARTLCDLVPQLLGQRLVDLVETQLTRRQPTTDDLIGCFEVRRRRGVSGMVRLGQVLADSVDDEPFPESKLEIVLFEGLRDIGVTGIHRQYRPPWFDGVRGVVDGADPIGRTIIEADGRRFRSVTAAHDNDRRRDRLAASHGWLTTRVGWRELHRDREGMLDEIAAVILARRRAAEAASAA